MTHHIWYHSPCADGLGAAYAAWSTLGESGIRYTPVAYGDPLPAIEPDDEVTLLDFSAPRADLLRLAQVAGRLTILDHHASAERALAGLTEEANATEGACEIRITFDQQHSGAVLAWHHFHHGDPVPELLVLIEDRDLWRFAWRDSKDLHYGIARIHDFRDLSPLVTSASALRAVVSNGWSIRDYLQGEWEAIASRAGYAARFLPDLHTVIVCQCPSSWFSDLGHVLLDRNPTADIALLYADNRAQGYTTVSLRSRQGGPDVSCIAARHGGGGHPQAAGFRAPLDGKNILLGPGPVPR